MADTRFGEQGRELDWENLSAPVPMDLIDPEFPAHPPAADSGAASRILPREESDALARETGMGSAEAASSGEETQAGETPGGAARTGRTVSGAGDAGDATWPSDPASHPHADTSAPGSYVDPRATLAGAPSFGDTDALQSDFARIRAEMEAEAEAERLRKAEIEREEEAQRARLEQWMANARARLLKADADLTGPAGRVRLRKDTSPSLYRLAEMQKTMHFDADATRPDGTASVPVQPPPDPMATISVSAEQFLGGDAPSTPPGRQAQMTAPPAAPAPVIPVTPASTNPNPWPEPVPVHPEAKAAPVFRDPPYESGPIPLLSASSEAGELRAMSREEALTRKVAKLRMAAETGENTLVLAPPPEGDGEGRALNFAIAAVVLIGILVLGLGLFAATQAGLFDGLENRIPFLKPKVATVVPPAAPAPAAAVPAAAPVPSAVTVAPAARAPGTQAPAARPAPSAANPRPAEANPSEPTAVPTPRNNAVTPRGPNAVAAKPVSARSEPVRAARAAPSSGKARKAAAQAAAAEPDDDIPAYARPPAKAGNLGEIILRNSVEAASHLEKDNLQELYNRYALGFPGLSGEIVIGLTVDPGGRILEGSIVSSTTGVEAFDQELLHKVLDWHLRSFPESRPKFISVPFLFPMQGH